MATNDAGTSSSPEDDIVSWSHLINLLQYTPYTNDALPLAVCGPWRLYGDIESLALYYSNEITNESMWEPPIDWDDSLAVIPPLAILKDWYIYRDITYGLQYFVSATTGKAVWSPPQEIIHLVIEGEGCMIDWEEAKDNEGKEDQEESKQDRYVSSSSSVSPAYPRSNRRSSIGDPFMVMIKTKLSKLSVKSLQEREGPQGTGDALVRVNDWLICQSSASESYGCIYFYHRTKGTSQWEPPTTDFLDAPDTAWRIATLEDVGALFLQTLNVNNSTVNASIKSTVIDSVPVPVTTKTTTNTPNQTLTSSPSPSTSASSTATAVGKTLSSSTNSNTTTSGSVGIPNTFSSTFAAHSSFSSTVSTVTDTTKKKGTENVSSSSSSLSSVNLSSPLAVSTHTVSKSSVIPIVINTPAPRSVFLSHEEEEENKENRTTDENDAGGERPTTSSNQREFAAMTKRLGHAPPAPLERPKSYANLPIFNFQSGLGLGLGRPGASIVRTRKYSTVEGSTTSTSSSTNGLTSTETTKVDESTVKLTDSTTAVEQAKEEKVNTWLASTIAATVDSTTGEKLLAGMEKVNEVHDQLTELEKGISALEKQRDELSNIHTAAADKRRYEINQQLIRHRQTIAKMSEWLANQKALAASETRQLLEQNDAAMSAERTAELERRKNETALLREKLKADRDRAVGNLSGQRKADAEKAKQAMAASLLAARQEEEARTKMIRERAEAERKRRSSVVYKGGGGGGMLPKNNAPPVPKHAPPSSSVSPRTSTGGGGITSGHSSSGSSSSSTGASVHGTSTTGRRNSLTNAGRSIVKG